MKIAVKSLSLLCCAAALCFCVVVPPSHAAADGNVLINKTNHSELITKACEFAQDKNTCVSTLKSQPASHDPVTDIGALAVIAIKVAQGFAKSTLETIKKNMNQTSSADPMLEQCLEDCQEHYESAMEQLDNSLAALTLKKLADAKIMVAAAMTDADSCEDGFKEENQKSVLGQDNGQFQKNCEVVAAVLVQVEKESTGKKA